MVLKPPSSSSETAPVRAPVSSSACKAKATKSDLTRMYYIACAISGTLLADFCLLNSYDHPSLIGLSDWQIEDQMNRLDDVLLQSIGERPTYMRPPYFDVDDHVLRVLGNLGYKVITSSIDTKDYQHNGEWDIDVSYNKFVTELDAGGSIVLSHDIHYWTVYKLVEEMLQEVQSRGLRGMFLVN